MSPKALSEAERAALDARDAALTHRFLARDPEAEREMCLRLDQLGFRVARKLFPNYAARWEEFRGAFFEVLGRYREEGLLREGESLYFLAQRVLKQAVRKHAIEAHRDFGRLSFDDAHVVVDAKKGKMGPDALHDHVHDLHGPAPDDQATAVAQKQLFVWLMAAVTRLAAGDRATYEAAVAVAEGEFATLAHALSCSPDAARQRLHSLRVSLAADAASQGAGDVAKLIEAIGERRDAERRATAAERAAAQAKETAAARLGKRVGVEPAPATSAPLAPSGASAASQVERPARARGVTDHVVDDLPDYAAGALAEAEKQRVSGHLVGCEDCRALYTAQGLVDESFDRWLVLPPPPCDVGQALAALAKGAARARALRRVRRGAMGVAVLALLAALASWFRKPPPSPREPPKPAVAAPPPVLLSAPVDDRQR